MSDEAKAERHWSNGSHPGAWDRAKIGWALFWMHYRHWRRFVRNINAPGSTVHFLRDPEGGKGIRAVNGEYESTLTIESAT